MLEYRYALLVKFSFVVYVVLFTILNFPRAEYS